MLASLQPFNLNSRLQLKGAAMKHDLAIRETFKFVGAYQHEDTWRSIGSCEVYAGEATCTDETDICEPHLQVNMVEVQVDTRATRKDIKQALEQTFTKSGCAHEHDCCGCRSFYASAKHVGRNVYRLTITSSRNF